MKNKSKGSNGKAQWKSIYEGDAYRKQTPGYLDMNDPEIFRDFMNLVLHRTRLDFWNVSMSLILLI